MMNGKTAHESTGGIGEIANGPPGQVDDDQPGSSAADVRRTIVVTLAGSKGLTPGELEQAVTLKLPGARHGLASTQLKVLQDGAYVEPVRGESRQLTLTAKGKRWVSGINALSGNPD